MPCNCPQNTEVLLIADCAVPFVTQRMAWRMDAPKGHSEAGGTLAERERRLQHWVELFALPERSPLGDGDLDALVTREDASEVDRGERGVVGSASHLFFVVPLEGETASFLFGVCCYYSLNESAVSKRGSWCVGGVAFPPVFPITKLLIRFCLASFKLFDCLQWEASAPAESKGLCGLCLISRVPFWGLLLFRLRAVSAAFFELLGSPQATEAAPVVQGADVRTMFCGFQGAAAKQMLDDLYVQLNTVNFHLLRYTEITFNLDANLPPFIAILDPREPEASSKGSHAVSSTIARGVPGGVAARFLTQGYYLH